MFIILSEKTKKKKINLFKRKNTEEYITFSVSVEKEAEIIDKHGELKKITKRISYRIQIIDSARYMASLLSNLVTNLAEGIHKIECEYGHNDKTSETFRIK